ncbi:helix-turn-helix domain-containing protein [Lysinibacillus xylanilyticus]|uniref:helix-turn-helix domain-containing protein n=1 Tax=Lysinibacillus xylanilyticus TaxID=582475 RepID=UPI003D06DFA6
MLGKRLKLLRAEKKITQEELGKVVNVTKVSISGYENGNRTPDTETLQALADFFNVSTDYLLGRADKRNENENNSLKGWLRSENEDLSENERKELEKDIQGYLAHRRNRILESRKNNK